MQAIPSLYIAESELGGRGVFTAAGISKGSVIEVCPVIVLSKADRSHLDETELHEYYFIWGKKDEECAIILGYGSLYNHSYEPNAEYAPDFKSKTLDFFALRDIKPGEEITVNYSGDPEGHIKVWFEVAEQR